MTTQSNLKTGLALLDQLQADQKNWHATIYKNASDKLLDMLALCQTAFQQLRGDRPALKALADKLKDAGITFNAGTHLSSRIVRYVFCMHNSRTAVYARVLRAAIEAKIPPQDLPEWVNRQGGIEYVRKPQKGNMTEAQRLDAAAELASEALLKAASLATISETSADLAPDASAELPFALALVRANDDAGYDIVYCTRNASLVRRALALVPKDVVTANSNPDAAQQQADKLARAEALAAQAATSVDTQAAEAA